MNLILSQRIKFGLGHGIQVIHTYISRVNADFFHKGEKNMGKREIDHPHYANNGCRDRLMKGSKRTSHGSRRAWRADDDMVMALSSKLTHRPPGRS